MAPVQTALAPVLSAARAPVETAAALITVQKALAPVLSAARAPVETSATLAPMQLAVLTAVLANMSFDAVADMGN